VTQSIDLTSGNPDLMDLVRKVMKGREITITLEDAPVAKMVPVKSTKRRRKIGSARGRVHIKEGFKDIPEGFEDLVP